MGVPLKRTVLLTCVALLAFAANSLLNRHALRDGAIDAASFTALRLASGAVALLAFAGFGKATAPKPQPLAAMALFAYAASFSYSYITLDAGMGALLLFGFVQLTMLGTGLLRGERLSPLQIAGMGIALAGLAWLCAPGVTAPDPFGALLMAGAGVAWGVYSLLGRANVAPAAATARNFLFAAPLGVLLLLLDREGLAVSTHGAILAIISGALTSGLGYVVWYAALRGHTRSSAGAVQLSVPVLAALGGVTLLDETLTLRLVGASALTLGGVALAIRRSNKS